MIAIVEQRCLPLCLFLRGRPLLPNVNPVWLMLLILREGLLSLLEQILASLSLWHSLASSGLDFYVALGKKTVKFHSIEKSEVAIAYLENETWMTAQLLKLDLPSMREAVEEFMRLANLCTLME
jgi:hypothetical protein